VASRREPVRFRDRFDAGRRLARDLSAYAGRADVLVLALPRGGVPVGYEVARLLAAPLDVFVVRKLGVPGHEELAMGALAAGGRRVINHEVVEGLSLSLADIEAVTVAEQAVVDGRVRAYRGDRSPLAVEGRTVILVDDGLATGATMRAAVSALREQLPSRLVVAVPVASRHACKDMEGRADEVVCAATPEPFVAVGAWYDDFAQTSDDEVRDLLARAGAWARGPRS
jgi:putative phosphoribosyl transferase